MIPLHSDRNVGPATYSELAERNQLLLSSMFYTYQGEGPFTGQPAIFLRAAGCNLGDKKACPWCDAAFEFDRGFITTAPQIAAFTEPYANRAELMVVTGGEPLLQWKALLPMMKEVNEILDSGQVWQFETNGILLTEEKIDEAMQWGLDVHFVISPKIINGKTYQPLDRKMLTDYGDITYLKFVVDADAESPYHNLPSEEELEGINVYVSGMTYYGLGDVLGEPGKPVSLFDLSEQGRWRTAMNYRYAAKLALERGFNVSYQTHLLGAVE